MHCEFISKNSQSYMVHGIRSPLVQVRILSGHKYTPLLYSPFGTPKVARTIIGPRCRIFSNGQFYTLWTYVVEMDFEWILKMHYFLFASSSSLCDQPNYYPSPWIYSPHPPEVTNFPKALMLTIHASFMTALALAWPSRFCFGYSLKFSNLVWIP